MSRRRAAVKREINPDAKFGDVVVAKFMNCMMLQGKKSVSESIFYAAMDKIQAKSGKSSIDLFHEALANVKPSIEVRSRRVGGATYQVPVEVRPERRNALSMRWLVEYARGRGEKSMALRLAGEILDASQGRGSAVKKREDVHRMAEANRAFSHYRF